MEPETEYPAWAVPFATMVVFIAGAFLIYFSLAFVNLEFDARYWSGLDRVVFVILAFLWARYVVKSADEVTNGDDGEE